MEIIKTRKGFTINEVVENFKDMIVVFYNNETKKIAILTKEYNGDIENFSEGYRPPHPNVKIGGDIYVWKMMKKGQWNSYKNIEEAIIGVTGYKNIDVQAFETIKEFQEWIINLNI